VTDLIQGILDLIPVAVWLITLLTLFVICPLALFSRTKYAAAIILFYVSLFYGAVLWAYGAMITFSEWGIFGLVIGILFLAVGVVPLAVVALVLRAEWLWLASFAALFASLLITRALSAWVIAKMSRREDNVEFHC
jgi:hypothetical protein